MGVEIAVKGNDGTEFLALLALESFKDSGLALCQQLFYLIIGKVSSGFLSEDRQSALLVVATHDLMEELHFSRSALGGRYIQIPCARKSSGTKAVRR